MKLRNNLLALLSLLALITGCVANQTAIKNYSSLNPNSGYVLVQMDSSWIGSEREKPPTMEIHYRLAGSAINSGRLTYTRKGNYFLFELKPGNYELNQISFIGGYIPFPFESKFNVTRGAITYIGHFNLEATFSHFFSPSHVTITDKLEALKQIEPSIFAYRIDSQVNKVTISR